MQEKQLIGKGWVVLPCLLFSGCVCDTSRMHSSPACCRGHGDRCYEATAMRTVQSGEQIALSEELAAQGRRLEAEQQTASAIRSYRLAVRMNPRNAAALNALGISLARQGRLTDARRALARAVAVQPDKPVYRNNLATVLVDQQRFDDALRQLVAANGADAGRHNLLHMLSVDFSQSGRVLSLIETLMSQQVDDAVYFGPVDGEDLALPIEENDTRPRNSETGADDLLPENDIPQRPERSAPLKLQPPRNVLPDDSPVKTGSTLKLIPPR